ncbi:porin family protein [Aquimarina rhabdastrellae]
MITLKKCVCLLAFCMLGLIVNAQKSKKISFGVKGGINFSRFSDSKNYDSESPKFGFHVGGVMEIPLSKRFALQPELFYTEIGSKREARRGHYNNVENEVNYKFTERLGYIKLPVLLKFYLNNRLSIDLGPELGYLVWADHETKIYDEGMTETFSWDSKRDYDDFDLSVNIGATYNFKNNMFVQARFSTSTYDIRNNTRIPELGQGRRNEILQFSMGYKF